MGVRELFGLVRWVLTALGGLLLAGVLAMVLFAVVVEGDSFDGPGANIGAGLLRLALIVNAPIWVLWLFPPYPKFLRRG